MPGKLEPLADRVIIKPAETEEVTKSGLIIPDTAKEKPQAGEVIAIGPGIVKDDGTRVPLDTKTGDRVMYSRYAGTEIKVDGEKLLIMHESDIIAIIGERQNRAARRASKKK